jgi:hypothetical protein
MPNARTVLTLLVSVVCGLAAAVVTARLVQTPPPQPAVKPAVTETAPADDLAAFDLAFRAAYARGRAETLIQLGPVVQASLDSLTLTRPDGRKETAIGIPPAYHRYKAVAHAPLAVYVALAPWGDRPMDNDRTASTRTLRAAMTGALEALPSQEFPDADRPRQAEILTASGEFLDKAIAAGRAAPADVTAFCRAMKPKVMANAYAAAKAQLDTTHAQMMKWKATLTPEEWSRLHAVILGPQMPRKENLLTQYFARLLGVPGECDRLVYAETLGSSNEYNLLATHTLDAGVAAAFFDDPQRMEIDLLAEAARDIVAKLDFAAKP